MEPYVGEIKMVGFPFAPRGWALCQGQLLSIAQNTALFSLLGTTYGGNGQTTFGLPDLRGRAPMNWGQGPGLSGHDIGQMGGTETVTLTVPQMPAHTHPIGASGAGGDNTNPAGNYMAVASSDIYSENSGAQMANPGVIGNSQPHDNMPPYLAVTFIIALEGIYPPRD